MKILAITLFAVTACFIPIVSSQDSRLIVLGGAEWAVASGMSNNPRWLFSRTVTGAKARERPSCGGWGVARPSSKSRRTGEHRRREVGRPRSGAATSRIREPLSRQLLFRAGPALEDAV